MKTKKVSLQELKNIIIDIAKQELKKENSTNKNYNKLSEMVKSIKR